MTVSVSDSDHINFVVQNGVENVPEMSYCLLGYYQKTALCRYLRVVAFFHGCATGTRSRGAGLYD